MSGTQTYPLQAAAERSSIQSNVGLGVFAVVLLGVVSYLSTPFNFWVGDDYNYLGPKGLDRVLGFFDPTVPSRAFYRPLNWTSWAIDYGLYGTEPFGWHLTSILFHLLAIVCVLFITWHLLHNWTLALLVAALFAVHPSHPETVTWIGGRADEVCGLFYFPAVLLFVLYLRRKEEGQGGRALYLGALLCAVGALLGKEMGVTVPIVLILTDVLFFTPEGKWRDRSYWLGRLRLYAPFLLLVAAYGAMRVYLVTAHIVTNTYGGPTQLSLPSLIDATASNILIALGVWSAPLHVGALSAVSKLALIAVVLAACVVAARTLGRPALYAVLWFMVTILPTSNLSAARWMYIPSFGVCLLIGLIVMHLASGGLGSRGLARFAYLMGWLLVMAWGMAALVENLAWYKSGEVARSTLNQIKALAPDPARPSTIYFSGAPANYGSALLWNTGLPSAMSLIYEPGVVDLHEVEQRLADPVIVDALKEPPALRSNPIYLGFSRGVVTRYNSLDELLRATGKRP